MTIRWETTVYYKVIVVSLVSIVLVWKLCVVILSDLYAAFVHVPKLSFAFVHIWPTGGLILKNVKLVYAALKIYRYTGTMKPRRNERNQRRAMIFCLGISFIAASVGNNATWSSTHPKYLQFPCIIRVCKRARYKALLEPQKVTGKLMSCAVCLKKSWQSLPIGHPIISGLQRAPI